MRLRQRKVQEQRESPKGQASVPPPIQRLLPRATRDFFISFLYHLCNTLTDSPCHVYWAHHHRPFHHAGEHRRVASQGRMQPSAPAFGVAAVPDGASREDAATIGASEDRRAPSDIHYPNGTWNNANLLGLNAITELTRTGHLIQIKLT